MGAAALALPALEIPVGRRRATLPCRQLVGVHPKAHGTARLTPVRPGGDDYLPQAFHFVFRPRTPPPPPRRGTTPPPPPPPPCFFYSSVLGGGPRRTPRRQRCRASAYRR